MREQHQAFLQAIVNEPDEDAHRLIYADWLEEQGDAAQAELIRLQVRRAHLEEDDPSVEDLELLIDDLLATRGSRLSPFSRAARARSVRQRHNGRRSDRPSSIPLLQALKKPGRWRQ